MTSYTCVAPLSSSLAPLGLNHKDLTIWFTVCFLTKQQTLLSGDFITTRTFPLLVCNTWTPQNVSAQRHFLLTPPPFFTSTWSQPSPVTSSLAQARHALPQPTTSLFGMLSLFSPHNPSIKKTGQQATGGTPTTSSGPLLLPTNGRIPSGSSSADLISWERRLRNNTGMASRTFAPTVPTSWNPTNTFSSSAPKLEFAGIGALPAGGS